MSTLRLILGDQLSQSVESLEGCEKSKDTFLMCDVWNEVAYEKASKKITFLFSSMRHFAKKFEQTGYKVEYTKHDVPIIFFYRYRFPQTIISWYFKK